MHLRPQKVRPLFAVAIAAVGLTLSAHAVAAPAIKVTRGTTTATSAKITVTGSGFTKRKSVEVEVDQNGAFSGDVPTTFTVTADSNGRISTTKTVKVTNACLLGIFATDQTTFNTSNGVDV